MPMLIGTDLQSKLGFMFLQEKASDSAMDLLSQQKVHFLPMHVEHHSTKPDQSIKEEPSAVVRLLNTVRLPAKHSR